MHFSTSLNFLFGELPFLERFSAARNAGFKGGELQFLEAEPAEIARASADSGLAMVLVNVDLGDLLAGGPGLSAVPGRENAFLEAVKCAAEAAETIGAGLVHLGPSRVPATHTREECLACYRANAEAVLRLEPFASGRLRALLEPMNAVDIPDALFTDVFEAAAWLEQELDGQVGLQFDAYHVAKGGSDLMAAWDTLAARVDHLQFSDPPSRGAPGTGTVDFPAFFAAVAASGYDRWVGAEYFVQGDTLQSLAWMEHLPC